MVHAALIGSADATRQLAAGALNRLGHSNLSNRLKVLGAMIAAAMKEVVLAGAEVMEGVDSAVLDS